MQDRVFACGQRRHKHARRHVRPCDGLKAGPALTTRNNRLSSGRAMLGMYLGYIALSILCRYRKLQPSPVLRSSCWRPHHDYYYASTYR